MMARSQSIDLSYGLERFMAQGIAYAIDEPVAEENSEALDLPQSRYFNQNSTFVIQACQVSYQM